MAHKIKVTYLDGREEIVAILAPTLIATEKHFKRDGGLADRVRIEGHYFMAWHALHKSGKEPAGFDEFIELIDAAEDYEDEPEDPTVPEPQPDESLS